MPDTNTVTPSSPVKQGLFSRCAAWLFSHRHFHFKLLSGTIAGVVVITFLAGLFLFVTIRNHQQETLRSHTIDVMRLSSVVENDVASLETRHRGFLISGDASFLEPFDKRRELLRKRIEELTALIIDSPRQRKRVMRVQEILQRWIADVALPQIASRKKGAALGATPIELGNSSLDEAREILRALQNDEQILLNERMRDQEWSAQSTQILDLVTKLDRATIEMQKEKRGYLLTGDSNFAEAYRRAASDFTTYHGYLSILVASSPEQTDALAKIRAAVDKWISTAAQPEIDSKRTGKDLGSAVSADTGESQLNDVHRMLEEFQREELDRYQHHADAATRERILKTSGLAMLCVFAVGLLIVSNTYSFVLVRRQLTKLEGVETRIRAIIENILDGMITVDEQGVIQSMNRAAERMFGCINHEMVGHKLTKLVPKIYPEAPDAQPTVCAWHDLAKKTGSTTLAVGRTRTHATFPVEISLSKMEADGAKLFVAMARDVTERKQFEKEIAADKEHLAVTLRSIGDGVITTDVQGRVIMINSAAENLTGWSSKDAIGQPLKTIFNLRIDLAAQARLQRSGYRSEAQSLLLNLPENATLKSRDGSEHVVEQVASPIRDSKNEVAGVVLVFRDITERQRNEAERRKAEMLEQLGLLAGGIAHDFNNLLTAIIGNISLASILLPSGNELTSRLNDAKNASMRARDLAQQLLTFARGGAPIKKTASIGKLIQDTVSFSLRGTHSRSEFVFGAGLWPAEIDSGQISQVVANLVVNADQAMPNGGTLQVACDNFVHDGTTDAIPDLPPGDYIRIAIKDQGVGITPECLKRIFDPYFTTKPKGTGLGLATTYSIIKNHNGLITVDSEVHVGSTFTIYLPALRDEQLPSEPPSVTHQQPVTGTGRVLIVDDEEAIRALVEFTLTTLGYEVYQAESALEGVNLYRQKLEAGERFDLVILDLTLPGGMGGKEALKKLIELDPTVNAIVSSGYAMDATMSRYRDFGFRGVIAKPYEAAELGRVVHEVIENSRVNLVEDFEGGRLATRVA